MLGRLGINSKPSLILFITCLFVLVLLWLLAVWRFRISPDFIPLHYTVYFGWDRFGPRGDIFLFPTLGTVIVGVNLVLATILFGSRPLWQGLWLGLTALMQSALLLALVLAALKTVA